MNQTITTQEITTPPIIQEQIPLLDKNWFKTGGPARFYAEPTDAESFQFALSFAREHNLEIFVLGEGANILISDDGFDGLVIRPQLNQMVHRSEGADAIVTAGAGVTMDALIEYCLNNNILGL